MPNFEILTLDNLRKAIPLLKQFHSESPYSSYEFDEEKVFNILNSPDVFVLVDLQGDEIRGVLVALTSYLMFSQDKIATELAWYIKPEYRNKGEARQWIDAFEWWAREKNCKQMALMNLADFNLDAFYTRLGFTCREHTYVKEL